MTMHMSDEKGSDSRTTDSRCNNSDSSNDGGDGDESSVDANGRRHHHSADTSTVGSCGKEMPPPLLLERHVGSYSVPGAFSMQPSTSISTSPLSPDVQFVQGGEGSMEASTLTRRTALHASLSSALSPPMQCENDESCRNCRATDRPATEDCSEDSVLPVADLVLPALVASTSITTATMSSSDLSAEASTSASSELCRPPHGRYMLRHDVEIAQEVYGGRIAIDVDTNNTKRRSRSWTLCIFKWSGIAILLLVAAVLPATYQPMVATASIPTTMPNTTNSATADPLSLLPWCVAPHDVSPVAFNASDSANLSSTISSIPHVSSMALGVCELLFSAHQRIVVDSIAVDTGTVYVTCLNVDSNERKMVNQTLPYNTADLCLDVSNSSDSSSIAQANAFSETVHHNSSTSHTT